MAPRAERLSGPTAIRYLLTTSKIYQRTVKDTVAVIQTAIEEGALGERKDQYPRVLMALAQVEQALTWTLERCRVLSCEATEEA